MTEVERDELVERLAECKEKLDIECPDLNGGERGALQCARYCIQLAGMLIESAILKAFEKINEDLAVYDEEEGKACGF